MNAFYDRSVRGLITGIALVLALMLLSDMLIAVHVNNEFRDTILQQRYNISSYLEEKGVDEITIAEALVSSESDRNGVSIVNKLGFNENYGFSAVPLAFAVSTVVISFFLLLIVLCFVMKRNKLYENAISDIKNNRTISVSYRDKGSIYRLFDSVNNMSDALAAGQETEQKAKEFLKQTISDISHQLKTPLSALSIYNELILGEPENIVKVTEFTQKSENAIDRIKNLILMLLKITRLDAAAVEFNIKRYSIRELLLKSVENLTKRAEKEGKTINISCGDEKIDCDFSWTSEAIGNIVKNALDNTEKGAVIHISCEKTPLENRIYISDNGRGIDSEDIHHIFKRFYRSKNSADTQGTGLGLPFAKAVADGQGGIISAESKNGIGTTFTLSFPNLTKM